MVIKELLMKFGFDVETGKIKQFSSLMDKAKATSENAGKGMDKAATGAGRLGRVMGDLRGKLDANSDAAKKLGDRMRAAGEKMASAGKALTVGLTLPLTAFATAAFKSWETLDEATDEIRAGTGATGAALQALRKDFDAVFKGGPQAASEVSTAIADLNTRLGLTGPPLRGLGRQMLDLAKLSKAQVKPLIASTTRLFGDWSIQNKDTGKTLDFLWKTSQSTGIGVESLSNRLVQFGAPLRQFGFSFQESAVMMGKWEKEGVNSELVLGSLRIAMGNFAKENIPLKAGLDATIRTIQKLGPGAKATALAMEVFGSRAGPDMAAAILEGRFQYSQLLKDLERSPETIGKAIKDSEDLPDRWKRVMNTLTVALEPVGQALLDVVEEAEPLINKFSQIITDLSEKFKALSPETKRWIIIIGGVAAAAGPVLIFLGSLMGALANLSPLLGIVTGVFRILWAVISALTSPIGLVIVAGIALGAMIQEVAASGGAWLTILAQMFERWRMSVVRSIQNAITSALSWLNNLKNQGVAAVMGFVSGVRNWLAGGFKAAIDVAMVALGPLLNGLRTMWSLAQKIPGVKGLLGGGGGGTPGVDPTPRAKGAIVSKPTFVLAGEAGPEAVVPLSRRFAGGGGVGGNGGIQVAIGDVIVHAPPGASPMEIGQAVMGAISDQLSFAQIFRAAQTGAEA